MGWRFWWNYLWVRRDWFLMLLVVVLDIGFAAGAVVKSVEWLEAALAGLYGPESPAGEAGSGGGGQGSGREPERTSGAPSGPAAAVQGMSIDLGTGLQHTVEQAAKMDGPFSLSLVNRGERMLYVTISDSSKSGSGVTYAVPGGGVTEVIPSVPLFDPNKKQSKADCVNLTTGAPEPCRYERHSEVGGGSKPLKVDILDTNGNQLMVNSAPVAIASDQPPVSAYITNLNSNGPVSSSTSTVMTVQSGTWGVRP